MNQRQPLYHQLGFKSFLKAIPFALAIGQLTLIIVSANCKLEGGELLVIGALTFLFTLILNFLLNYFLLCREQSKINTISLIISIIVALGSGYLATHEIINKMPISISYSKEEIAEVDNYYYTKYWQTFDNYGNHFDSEEELHCMLQELFDISFKVSYSNDSSLDYKGKVLLLDLGRHLISINNDYKDYYHNCYYISHEIRHLKGDINEAWTSFNACKNLIESGDNFCINCGCYFILSSLRGLAINRIYDFTQLICDDYYKNIALVGE